MNRSKLFQYASYFHRGILSLAVASSLACSSGGGPNTETAQTRSERVNKQVNEFLTRAREEMKSDDYDSALANVDKAYKLDRNNPQIIRLRREIQQQMAQQGTTNSPRSQAAIARADSLFKENRYEEAEVAYANILKAEPGNKDAQYGLKRSQERLAKQNEREIERLVAAAKVSYRNGELDTAENQLSQAIKLGASENKEVRSLTEEIQNARDAKAAASTVVAAAPTAVPTVIPTPAVVVPTATPRAIPTPEISSAVQALPTATPAVVAQVATPKPTATPTPAPTATPTPRPTATPTPAPTASPTATPRPTATPTPAPTATPAPSPTPAPTATPRPTATPTPAPTATPTPAPTATATPAPTATPVPAKLAPVVPLDGPKTTAPVSTPAPVVVTPAPVNTPNAQEAQEAAERARRAEEARLQAAASKAVTPVATATATPAPVVLPIVTVTPTPAPTPVVQVVTPVTPATPIATPSATPTPEGAEAPKESEKVARKVAKEYFEKGVDLYDESPNSLPVLTEARALWSQALEADPTFEQARTYLAETETRFANLTAEENSKSSFESREKKALEMMAAEVSIDTRRPIPLKEFLNNIRFFSNVDFIILGGVDAQIEASLQDKPLQDVLDQVLLPIGLKWDRRPGENTIVISPDLQTSIVRLPQDQIRTIDALIQRGTLQQLLYNNADGRPKMDGQELYTDAREGIVVITDSRQNIEKFMNLVGELETQRAIGLQFATFTIRPEKAQQIKALIQAILPPADDAPYNPERKLIIEGDELIVKDTLENIGRIEAILQQREFLKKIYDGQIQVRTFNLTPVLEIEGNPDLARQFAENIYDVIETLLYSQDGVSVAASQGRRIWYDEATLQLTITDFPDRLDSVERFINQIPQLKREKQFEIFVMNFANAGDVTSTISRFLGISDNESAGGNSGSSVTKTLRREQSFEFNNARFTVLSVNENDVDDELDDDVEIVVTSGDQEDTVTIEELRLENVLGGEFSILADDINPSSTPKEGRARLIITYNPEQANNANGNNQVQQQQQQQTSAQLLAELEQNQAIVDISRLEAIEELNAIYVEYAKPADLEIVRQWIDLLDVPIMQVSIEAKFVEVIENKARQLKADFSVGDLTEGVNLSDSIISNRFAQDSDEFQSPFEPLTENAGSANLLKGASVTNWIINNGQSPISLSIRALEAQGVINVVNAPSITVLHNQTATFEIRRSYATTTQGTSTGTGTNNNNTGGTNNNNNNGGGGTNNNNNGGGTTNNNNGGGTTNNNNNNNNNNTTSGATATGAGGFSFGAEIDIVESFEVTPTVTQAGDITLDPIIVALQDFDNNLGALQPSTPTSAAGLASLPQAVRNTGGFGIYSRDIETYARIRDGGTIVLGGWKNDRIEDLESGVPILKDIPFIGKFLFNRTQYTSDQVTLLIFLTGSVVRD